MACRTKFPNEYFMQTLRSMRASRRASRDERLGTRWNSSATYFVTWLSGGPPVEPANRTRDDARSRIRRDARLQFHPHDSARVRRPRTRCRFVQDHTGGARSAPKWLAAFPFPAGLDPTRRVVSPLSPPPFLRQPGKWPHLVSPLATSESLAGAGAVVGGSKQCEGSGRTSCPMPRRLPIPGRASRLRRWA